MKLLSVGLFSICLSLPGALWAQTAATAPAKQTTSTATRQPGTSAPKSGTSAPASSSKQTSSSSATKQTSPAPAAKPAATTGSPADSVARRQIPETRVERLISEREQLVLQYDYLKTQESSFWGNASKEDMRLVIDALKAVLKKDEEIIQAVEQANLETRRAAAQRAAQLELETRRLNSQVQGDKRVVTDNIYDLKTSLAYAQNLNRRREREITDLKEQLQSADDAKFEHDAVAAVMGLIAIALAVWVFRLRTQLSELKEEQTSRQTS